MLNFCDFIQVYVFTTNHHLNELVNKANDGPGVSTRTVESSQLFHRF